MAFEPWTMSGETAAALMLSWGTYKYGYCLEAVSNAFPFPASDNPGFYQTATLAASVVPMSRRHYDTPPAGAVVYMAVGNQPDGHICISTGGGNVVSTDMPSRNQIGIVSIGHIERTWGATFLFWSDWFCGHNIVVAGAAPALRPHERRADSRGVNRRGAPNTIGEPKGEIVAGDTGEFKGYIRGEDPYGDGNNVWFVGLYSGDFFWSGRFTDSGTHDLQDLGTWGAPVPAKPPVIVVPPVIPPKPVITEGNPDIIDVFALDFPAWMGYEGRIDAADDNANINREAYEYYAAKGTEKWYRPEESHVHWWGSPTAGLTHDGVVAGFLKDKDFSVNFVVSAGRITKMVSLPRIAYTTGARNPFAWKTENDPRLTDAGYLTLAALHFIIEKKNPRLKGEPIRLHSEFMATACSAIDVKRVRDLVSKFESGELDIATGKAKPPVVVPPVVVIPDPEIPTPTEPTIPTVPVPGKKPVDGAAVGSGIVVAIMGILWAIGQSLGWWN